MTELPTPSGAAGLPSLGAPPLIAGESAAAYDDLLARIRAALQPSDILEEIWVRDIGDLAWEVLRLRRLKAQLMRVCARRAMADVLGDLPVRHCYDISKGWHAGDAHAAETVNKALAAAGLGMDAVMALALSQRIETIERIERMMTVAEVRRDAALRELERRRASLAQGVRRAIRAAEDAQFTVIAPSEAAA